MAEKETFSVRLSPDMANAVREYSEEHSISKADTLRRAVRDQYLRPTPDGSEVIERVDELVNLGEIAFIVAYFTGAVGGPLALLAGIAFIVAEAATLAYTTRWHDD